VEFRYTECEGDVWRPYLPVTFSHGSKQFPVGSALVDTGSDLTLLPLAIAHALEIELDDSQVRRIEAAGGSIFVAMPSQNPVGFTIRAPRGYRNVSWKGTPFFSADIGTILLGHEAALQNFDIAFYGPDKRFSILPRQ
jgi:hypothetical protein